MKKQKTTSIQSLHQHIQALQKQAEEHQAEILLLNDKIELQQRLIENQEEIIATLNVLIETLKQRSLKEEPEQPEKPN